MKTLKITFASLLALQLASFGGTFDSTSRANVWINTGGNSYSYHIPKWSQSASFQDGLILVGSTEVARTKSSDISVLVNDVATSYPTFISPLPLLSMVGLDSATGNLGDDLSTPSLSVIPNGGTFDNTVEVRLLLGAQVGDKEVVQYKIDNGALQTVELEVNDVNASHSLYISKNGTHVLQYRLRDVSSIFNVASFTINNNDIKRDSDGDGIPDIVEAELGENPLEVENVKGWSKFDKYLRNNDLNDSDNDGWSDFDEEVLRGTDKYKDVSKPTATTLYGREYKVQSHAEENDVNKTSLYRVSLVDILANTLYDSQKIETLNQSEEYYNKEISVATATVLTNMLQQGTIPKIRIPAQNPVVERVRENNASNSWVGKTFIKSLPDASVKEYYEAFKNDDNVTDVNLSSFANGYIEYLKKELVHTKDITVDNNSSLRVSMMESALRSRVDDNKTLLLGHPDIAYNQQARVNTLTALHYREQSFNMLFEDLKSLSEEYPLDLSGLNEYLHQDDNTTELQLADFMQNRLSDTDKYRVSLMTIVDFDTADMQANENSSNSVMDPTKNSDNDTLSNSNEVLRVAFSDPLVADSDGDGILDDSDPCVNDAKNECLNNPVSVEDSDSDGVVDSVDNCPFDANTLQADKDGDGIGDICAKRGIVITHPRTNLTLLLGEAYTFAAKITDGSQNQVYWEVDSENTGVTGKQFTHRFDNAGDVEICADLENSEVARSCVTVHVVPQSEEVNLFNAYGLSIYEGNSGSRNALVELSFTKPVSKAVTYHYATSDYTATAGEDYNATDGNVTFDIGENKKYISVAVLGDTDFETDEGIDFSVMLTDGLVVAQTRLMIYNDDAVVDDNGTDNNGTDDNTTTGTIDDVIMFSFSDDAHGEEPWVSDGTAENTHLLKDIVSGQYGSYPNNFTRAGEYYYFEAYGDNGATLYQSDGTQAGTIMIKEFDSSTLGSLQEIDNKLYFIAVNYETGEAVLHKVENTTLVTLATLYKGGQYAYDLKESMLTQVGENLYFNGNLEGYDEYDSELYRYSIPDDTVTLVKDLTGDGNGSNPQNMLTIDGALYFVANSNELYTTSGTADSTKQLASGIGTYIHENSSYSSGMLHIGKDIYLSVYDSNNSGGILMDYNVGSSSLSQEKEYSDDTNINGLYNVNKKLLFKTYLYDTQTRVQHNTLSDLSEVIRSYDGSFDVVAFDDRYYTLEDGSVVNSNGDTVFDNTENGYTEFYKDHITNKVFFKVSVYDSDNSQWIYYIYVTDGTTTGTKQIAKYIYVE
jgi:ELWxxDGT repeat protein